MIEVRGVLATGREQRPVRRGWGAVHWLSVVPLFAAYAVMLVAWLTVMPYGVAVPEHVFWSLFLGGIAVWWAATTIASRLIFQAVRKAPISQAASDWVINEEGLSVSSSLYASRVSWPCIHDVMEEPDRFVFLVSPYNNFALPRRVLDSEQIEALRTMLASVKSSGRLGAGVD